MLRSLVRHRAQCARVLRRGKLTEANMNHNIRDMDYAVRGAIVLRATELDAQLQQKKGSLPFDEVIYCNIGNPQQLQQPPITFFRQVLSLVENPALLEKAAAAGIPNDAIQRAKEYLNGTGCYSDGAYTHSKGFELVRQQVAQYIEQRDGYASNPEHIFLTDGASPGVKGVMSMIVRDQNDGVMCPIPQYPLYSATLTALNGTLVPYYLDEANQWGMSVAELDRAYTKARSENVNVRSLAVINPGNPTGQVLEEQNVRDIVQWAEERDVILLADEVYQTNVYPEDKAFHSFKKAVRDLNSKAELFSFHSVSKGVIGECGKRGGYVECTNIDEDIVEQFYKVNSVNLCPNTIGQMMVGLMVCPPTGSDPSAAAYTKETTTIFDSLARRAKLLAKMLNSLEGVTCNESEGAMYAFPQVRLPDGAIAEAGRRGVAPDAMYCMELLENTGIVVVPGSGFGQVEGTWHFRTTFLPREEQVEKVAALMQKFHADFMNKYR